MTTRRQSLPTHHGSGRSEWQVFGTPIIDETITCLTTGWQETISEGHPWPPPPSLKHSDVGGMFFTWKNEVISSPATVNTYNTSKWPDRDAIGYRYSGPQFAYSERLNATRDHLLPSPDHVLASLGSTGIARALPTNPLSGMGQFLGELKDLPKLPVIQGWKKQALNFRNLARRGGSEYLNVQFGWIPFIKDIQAFCETVRDSEKVIKQYDRNSGKNVRRRRRVVSESNTDPALVSPIPFGGNPTIPTYCFDTYGNVVEQTSTARTVDFAGAFTYYLPPSGVSGWSKAKRAEQLLAHMYGLRISPELLWQLAPWSWAVDWVSNAGDVIRNWSAFQNDGLILRYGYVMEEKVQQTTWHVQNCVLKKHGALSTTQTLRKTCKVRVGATPYGFGLDPGTFSDRQWSIIIALGISRGR